MNKERRERIAGALATLRQAGEEEREYYDNMPESIQSSEKGEKADEIASALENTVDEIEAVLN